MREKGKTHPNLSSSDGVDSTRTVEMVDMNMALLLLEREPVRLEPLDETEDRFLRHVVLVVRCSEGSGSIDLRRADGSAGWARERRTKIRTLKDDSTSDICQPFQPSSPDTPTPFSAS